MFRASVWAVSKSASVISQLTVDTVTILPNSQLSVKLHLAPLTSYTSFVSFIHLIFIDLKNLLFSLLSQDPHGHHFEWRDVQVPSFWQRSLPVRHPCREMQRLGCKLPCFQGRLSVQELQKCWWVRGEDDSDARCMQGKSCLWKVFQGASHRQPDWGEEAGRLPIQRPYLSIQPWCPRQGNYSQVRSTGRQRRLMIHGGNNINH